MYHSEPRYTKDVDIVIAMTDDDTQGTANALAEFGFPLTEDDLTALRTPKKMIVLGRAPARIDILNEVKGIVFDEAYARRIEVPIGGVTVPIISLEDLIQTKIAAGRPQDKIDLKALRRELKVRDQKDGA